MKRYIVIAILITLSVSTVAVILFVDTDKPDTNDSRDAIIQTDQPSGIDNTALTQNKEVETSRENADNPEVESSEKTDWLTDVKPVKKYDNPWIDFQFGEDVDEETAEENVARGLVDIDMSNPSSYKKLQKYLVNKYGDTAQVQEYLDTWLNLMNNPNDHQAHYEHDKAVYALIPHPIHEQNLEISTAIVNGDTEAFDRYAEKVDPPGDQFEDVEPFFKNNEDRSIAFRKLREFDPRRSAEFERFILNLAKEDDSIDINEIRGYIEKSYENPDVE